MPKEALMRILAGRPDVRSGLFVLPARVQPGGPTITTAATRRCLSAARRHRAARHSASSIYISRERKIPRAIGGIAGSIKVNRIGCRTIIAMF
jgi:hypothetical protein